MCWSEGASMAMVGLGTVATVVTARRGDPGAIPVTLAYFTLMEALQVGGYWVIDECGTRANQAVTLASYLHIAFQPLFINAFAMAIFPAAITPGMRRAVYALAGIATLLLLTRIAPIDGMAPCRPGDPLCGAALCTVSGNWHIAWELPLGDLWGSVWEPLRRLMPFPEYFLAVFALPLAYGAWRFVIMHAVLGPVTAAMLTDNPNEMPAIWCLFSIGLLLIGLSPAIRGTLMGHGARTAA